MVGGGRRVVREEKFGSLGGAGREHGGFLGATGVGVQVAHQSELRRHAAAVVVAAVETTVEPRRGVAKPDAHAGARVVRDVEGHDAPGFGAGVQVPELERLAWYLRDGK